MPCVVFDRGRMLDGLPLELLARIWERRRLEEIEPSAIRYRPCCFPAPTLMTTSASMGWLVGS